MSPCQVAAWPGLFPALQVPSTIDFLGLDLGVRAVEMMPSKGCFCGGFDGIGHVRVLPNDVWRIPIVDGISGELHRFLSLMLAVSVGVLGLNRLGLGFEAVSDGLQVCMPVLLLYLDCLSLQ